MTETPHIQDLIAQRLSRRGVLGGAAGLGSLALAGCATPQAAGGEASFKSVAATNADAVTVPTGYSARTLIAWGDALFDGAGPLDLDRLTRAEQEARFGQNNDMLAIFPARWGFPWRAEGSTFVMCANHEYFDPSLMWPGLGDPRMLDADRTQAMMASMGVTVMAVQEDKARKTWRVVTDPRPGAGVNRRITPFTPVAFTGPAASHPWIAAAGGAFRAAEGGPAGTIPCGTLANCAGGYTPWGTYLTSEENFDSYFMNSDPAAAASAAADPALAADARSFRYPLTRAGNPLPLPVQYDLARNPTGGALYGWNVEIDPYDPASTPKKRTALGRRKGECATTALTRDGRVAVYSGDDQANEFVYKFVSTGRFDPANRAANMDLLDEGVLYAAKLSADGAGVWVALTLEAANAAAAAANYPAPFKDLGDVCVRAREAARLLGATPMDRPEDVEAVRDGAWVGQGSVLIACTANLTGTAGAPGNPRRSDPEGSEAARRNVTGHVLRFDEAGGDCGALAFAWDIFVLAGDPAADGASTNRAGQRVLTDVSVNGLPTFTGDRFANPDNFCLDRRGNIWITTDGSDGTFADCNDQILMTRASAGPREVKRFLVGPVGAEICGPLMSLDERTLFAAIQHPGESDVAGLDWREARFQRRQTKPPSSFPDGGWPRSAVVYVTKDDGGLIGT
jgi:secreted PhoX family phosphatase